MDLLPLDFIPRLALASSPATSALPAGEPPAQSATAINGVRSSRSLDDGAGGRGSSGSSSGRTGRAGFPLLLPLLSPERFVVVPGGLSRLSKVGGWVGCLVMVGCVVRVCDVIACRPCVEKRRSVHDVATNIPACMPSQRRVELAC